MVASAASAGLRRAQGCVSTSTSRCARTALFVSEMRKSCGERPYDKLQGLAALMLLASCFDNADAQVCLCAV